MTGARYESWQANFSPVMPAQCFYQCLQAGMKFPYLLVLAHDIVENADAWLRLKSLGMFNNTFIILDNSVVELGDAVSYDMMSEAAEIIEPNVAVLPDVMRNAQATLERSMRAAVEWKGLRLPYMAVLQGSSLTDFREPLYEMMRLPGVEYISIPKCIAEDVGTRREHIFVAAEAMESIPAIKGIHLLGFGDSLADDISCSRHLHVMGIDSAVPIRMGLKGMGVLTMPISEAGPRGDFWEVASKGINELAIQNIRDITERLQ